MNDTMGIPNTLKDFGIIESEFQEKLNTIAENAVGDACTGSNPRPIDPAHHGQAVYLYLLRH